MKPSEPRCSVGGGGGGRAAHQVRGAAAGEEEIFHSEVAGWGWVRHLNLLLRTEARAPHF